MKRKILSVIIALSFVLSLLGQVVQTNAATTQEYNGFKYSVSDDGKNITIEKYSGSDTTIRIPSNMYKNISIVKNICDNFEKENGREPSVEEVMNLSGLKYEVVSYILNNNYQLTSLDVPVADESDSVLGDFIVSDCDVEEEICRNELKILVENLLHNADLSQKEIDVLCYRYGLYTGECMTLNEIGKIVGISKERVLQIESRAINRVRRKSIGTGIDKYVK